jgi:hypothetical protein
MNADQHRFKTRETNAVKAQARTAEQPKDMQEENEAIRMRGWEAGGRMKAPTEVGVPERANQF